MGRVLFIYENDIPTVSIFKDTFSNLTEAKGVIFSFSYLTKVDTDIIDANDVIVFIRPMNVLAWKIAENAQKTGHIVVTFCDDDLLNLPKELPSIPWRRRGLIRVLRNTDIVWSSSEYILKKYSRFARGKRIAHTDTIIREEELEGIEIKHDGAPVKIVYAAGDSHTILFEKYIKPVIPELFHKYGDGISLTFVGVHPDIGDYKCEYVPGMPLLEYRKYMRESRFDIGLAPLHEDDFSKCKYFNKFIEYSTQGIVGVYTKTEPYTYVIMNGENGYLAENTPESWFSALCEAIEGKEKREQCVSNAIDYLKHRHSEKTIVDRMLSEIPEMKESNHTYKKCGSFFFHRTLYKMSRLFDWLYLTFFYLFHNGTDDVRKRAYRRLKGLNVYGGTGGDRDACCK